MFRILAKWLVVALTVLAVPHVIEGVYVQDLSAALAVAAVLGILNVTIRPILKFLTFPITLITFGLFLLVINAVIFLMAGNLVNGIQIQNFTAALLAAAIVSFVSWIVQPSRSYT